MIALNGSTNFASVGSPGRAYVYWRDLIHNGDFLLWRPTSWAGKLICWFTGQEYSHVSMAVWVLHDDKRDYLYNAEMIQFHGGRRERLSKQVARWPGACDVYRPKNQHSDELIDKDGKKYRKRVRYNGKDAAYQMLFLMSRPYGWRDFFWIALNLVLDVTLPKKQEDSSDPDASRVCSAAVSYAARVGGGIDVGAIVGHNMPDALTTPGVFADPKVSRYIATLHLETQTT